MNSLTPMAPSAGVIRFRTNIPEHILGRHPYQHRRTGGEIAQGSRRGAPASSGVILLPGGAWSMQPFQGALGNLVTDDYADAVVDPGTQLNLGGGMLSVNAQRLPTELLGVGADVTAGNTVKGIKKQVRQGGSYSDAQLAADVAAVPQPPSAILSPLIPLDRVASGKVTWGPNDGAALMWEGLGNSFVGHTAFLNFYLGGSADVVPFTEMGGAFCLSLIGDGTARLWELEHAPGGISLANPSGKLWALRKDFQWGGNLLAGNQTDALMILPYGRDRIAFVSPRTYTGAGYASAAGITVPYAYQKPVSNQAHTLYQEAPVEAGHIHAATMTGPGVIRMDSRRDIRKVYSSARIKYPSIAYLVDEPFEIPGPLPANTPIRVRLDSFLLPGTSFTGQVYDADTHLPLTWNPLTEGFNSVAAQHHYYVVIAFHPSASRFSTPILWGYVAEVGGFQVARNNVPVKGGRIKRLSIQGAGASCDTESASFDLHDPRSQMTILERHDGQACDLVVEDSDGNIISRLMEGVGAKSEAHYRGSKQARLRQLMSYGVHVLGRSSRLAEQVPTGKAVSFAHDPNPPLDLNGNPLDVPWLAVDVLRFCLYMAGAGADEIDIPARYNDVRFWAPPGRDGAYYLLQPGGTQVYLRLAKRICKEYFQAILFRDANAGTRGMWRVLANPGPVYGPALATFYQERPDVGEGLRLGSVPGTWGAAGTFIRTDTMRITMERPEVNHVVVYGVADAAAGSPTKLCWNELYNDVSHDFQLSAARSALYDPNHPDALGREVPVYVRDFSLWGQEAVDWACRRIFDRAAHAWERVVWQSPCLMITDPSDPYQTYQRPLHVNDEVVVQRKYPDLRFSKAVIRDVRIDVNESDRSRWAWYDAQYVDH